MNTKLPVHSRSVEPASPGHRFCQPRESRLPVPALLIVGLLAIGCIASGCSNRYVLVTTNGTQITSEGKPKLVDGYYRFEDTLGRQMALPALRVREITPASMMDDEEEGKLFTPQTKTVR